MSDFVQSLDIKHADYPEEEIAVLLDFVKEMRLPGYGQ